MQLCTTPQQEEINAEEEARLRQTVARSTVSCYATTIQTAVTTAALVFNEDWSQEGRKLLREFGLPTCAGPAPMHATC